ncbi:MAG: hypothetical protein IPK95_00790 [Cellvibrionales bacterium]|nr:hypothetical protein [Cellvibrionales bacterium]
MSNAAAGSPLILASADVLIAPVAGDGDAVSTVSTAPDSTCEAGIVASVSLFVVAGSAGVEETDVVERWLSGILAVKIERVSLE